MPLLLITISNINNMGCIGQINILMSVLFRCVQIKHLNYNLFIMIKKGSSIYTKGVKVRI